jgi:hypothetical protein
MEIIMEKAMIIIVEEIPESEGGGYEASIEGLRFYLLGDGDDPVEALENLITLIKTKPIDNLFDYCNKIRRRHGI